MSIPQRRIGRDGPLTGVLSLGSWHTYDRMDFREAVTLLRTAVDAGITLFDVAVYGFPGSPPVFTDVLFSAMVRAAGLRREDYLLSAKLWLEGYPAQSLRVAAGERAVPRRSLARGPRHPRRPAARRHRPASFGRRPCRCYAPPG